MLWLWVVVLVDVFAASVARVGLSAHSQVTAPPKTNRRLKRENAICPSISPVWMLDL